MVQESSWRLRMVEKSCQKAEYFASKSEVALSTLMIALNNAHLGLTDYLDAIGTGFEKVIKETSADSR